MRGGGGFTQSEQSLIHKLGVSAIVEQRSINDKSLQLLYQQAFAFIFPTFYEGFGIPILEAFACNCPCIVSNTSSLLEVGGNAVLYIDPNSSESMIYAVERLLNDSGLREKLIYEGRKQLTKFSWGQTATKTIELYRNLV